MKYKVFFIIFSLISFVYADVRLNAVSNDNFFVVENSASSTETYESASGVSISVTSTSITGDENVKFSVEIKNNGAEDFYFDENSISAFAGKVEAGSWNPGIYYPASKYAAAKNRQIEEQKTAQTVGTCALIGCGVIALDLFLIDVCSGDDPYDNHGPAPRPVPEKTEPKPNKNPPAPRPEPPKRPVPPEPKPRGNVDITYDFGALPSIVTSTSVDSSDAFDSSILLYSSVIKPEESLSGIIYVKKSSEPDYKLTFRVSDEESVDFYFTCLNKTVKNNLWNDEVHSSIVCSLPLPYFDGIGLYYLYCGNPVGFYFGFDYGYPVGIKNNTNGTLDKRGNYYPDYEGNGLKSDPAGYYYVPYDNNKFVANGKEKKESFSFYGGSSIKILPYTYLMLGCGIDFAQVYYQGDYIAKYNDSDEWTTVESDVWAESTKLKIYCCPQIGVNFIFDAIDLAGTFQYKIGDGPSFSVMFGFAI